MENIPLTRGFFDKMKEHRVEYDVIGFSFYPWSHGTLLDLRDNLRFTALHYGKEIIVVETGYHYQPSRYFRQVSPPFPETPQGHANGLRRSRRSCWIPPTALAGGCFGGSP